MVMHFEYPEATAGTPVAWEISLLSRDGSELRQWSVNTTMRQRNAHARINRDGPDSQARPLAAGYSTVRLRDRAG